MNIYLVSEKSPSAKAIPFNLSLYSGENVDQLTPVEGGIEIDRNSTLEVSTSTGVAQVSLKILQPSGVSLFNSRKFFLVAQPSLSEHFQSVGSGFSEPLVAVNYRLVITNGHELPPIYYNATKGKGNKMVLKVHLIDSTGKRVMDRPNLKLNFVLHYEDNTTVDQSKKQILEASSDSNLFIGETGEAIFKFRIINAVTSKHKQRFKISVSADSVHNAARYNDVSFDYSPCIDVRTKVDEKAKARREEKKRASVLAKRKPVDDLSDDFRPKQPPTLERQHSLSEVPTLDSRPPSFGSLGSIAGPSNSLSFPIIPAPSFAMNAWAELILDKIEKIRWKRIDEISPQQEDYSEHSVHMGHYVCNPNAIIDEIVSYSKNILNPCSDSAFMAAAQRVDNNNPPPMGRAHSLRYDGLYKS